MAMLNNQRVYSDQYTLWLSDIAITMETHRLLIGKSSINYYKWAIFYSHVKLPEGIRLVIRW